MVRTLCDASQKPATYGLFDWVIQYQDTKLKEKNHVPLPEGYDITNF